MDRRMTGLKDSSTKRVLIAGVGNRLMSDDGFGPRVIDLLSLTPLPKNVEARDIGTAGLTIATDLSDYDLVVFVDSINMDGKPGQLQKSNMLVEKVRDDIVEISKFTLHEVGLQGLLEFAKAIGTLPPRVVLIGCEPKAFGPSLELSPEVEDALPRAGEMVLATVNDFLSERND
jgi:hydrogenase maturation protease